MNTTILLGRAVIFGCLLSASALHAGLTDETQTTPNVSGGAIAKSLEQQVGAGHGDEFTYGSAVYLIKRDPARSIRRGRQLFQRKFTMEQGFGPRVSAHSAGDIRTMRALGAGMVDSCAGCHGRPRGAAGFGGDVVTRPDSRDAPHLFGLGLQEMLAQEITVDLRRIRDRALADATSGVGDSNRQRSCRGGRDDECRRRRGSRNDSGAGGVTRTLQSKGVSFGSITAHADGTLDLSGIEGVDDDLRVRPFFHHGETASIREFVVGAFKAEMGLEAPDPILCDATDPDSPQLRTSPSGFVFDPDLDTFERPPVCDESTDGDGDLVRNEIDTALIDHMEFYLLNYFKAGQGRQTSRAEQGRQLMDQVQCTGCHVQNHMLVRDRRIADVETVHDPINGQFNRLFATASTRFQVVEDTEPYPLLLPENESFLVENIYTDFKRHDLGEAFHEREYDGTEQTMFLTEALWGVGSTAPYGHDGRSINLEEVILRHGGEAQASRDAYSRLNENDQRKIVEFLQTLVLFPPDDTASNLNPGNPGSDIQEPENHGSINLGALFQIPAEGPE